MTGAVVLSAGASSRMGRPKALLQVPLGIQAETFLARIVATLRAAQVDLVVVAIGPPHGEAIRAAHQDLGVLWAWNDEPRRGMLSSIQAGLRRLMDEPDAAGALVWPVDIPLVRPETVRCVHLAGLCGQGPALVPVVPTWGGRGGHPIWLPARLFPEAIGLPVEAGLRPLLSARRAEVVRLPVEDPDILRDFDSPADLGPVWAGPLKSP